MTHYRYNVCLKSFINDHKILENFLIVFDNFDQSIRPIGLDLILQIFQLIYYARRNVQNLSIANLFAQNYNLLD